MTDRITIFDTTLRDGEQSPGCSMHTPEKVRMAKQLERLGADIIEAGFQTLVDAGYQPEIAYFECLHELKLIVDLMYRGGLNYMRYSVSDTAEHGDYTGGPRLVNDQTRAEMKKMLEEIRSGAYAEKWIKENEDGRPWFNEQRSGERDQLLEQVGARLRTMMPFLDAVEVTPEGDVKKAAERPEGVVR